MKIKLLNEVSELPADMDSECTSLCYTLNRLPGLETYCSCSGHGKRPFYIWFRCNNIDTLSRLGRVVDKRYSDGNWEIVLDSCDGNPRGCFWLRSKSVLSNDELLKSINRLDTDILYWFQDTFDEYFSGEQYRVQEEPDVRFVKSTIDYWLNMEHQQPVQLATQDAYWQQVRIQFVGQIASAIIGNYQFYAEGIAEECERSGKSRPEMVAQMSLEIADALIEGLEKGGER